MITIIMNLNESFCAQTVLTVTLSCVICQFLLKATSFNNYALYFL